MQNFVTSIYIIVVLCMGNTELVQAQSKCSSFNKIELDLLIILKYFVLAKKSNKHFWIRFLRNLCKFTQFCACLLKSFCAQKFKNLK